MLLSVCSTSEAGIGAPMLSFASSAKLAKYFDSLELLISETFSQLSQIEKAVAFEIWQLEF